MKMIGIAIVIVLLASCSNHSGSSKTTDSVSINTTESSKADGGPTHGLGDTNSTNQVSDSAARRMNDTMAHDTPNKK